MGSECPVCGENAVVEYEHGLHCQKICEECGAVDSASETQFASVESYSAAFASASGTLANLDHAPWSIKRNIGKSESHGKKFMRSLLKNLTSFFKFDSSAVEECELLMNRCHHSEEFYMKPLIKKHVLCTCCVYCVARNRSVVITIREICQLTKCDPYAFGKCLIILKQKFDVRLPELSLGSMSATMLGKIGFTHSQIELCQGILAVSDRCWLVTGRQPQSIILAAAYVSWQASDIVKNRKVNFNKFCDKHKIKHSKPAKKAFQEIKDALNKLVNKLPWAITDQGNDSYLYHLDDILNYKNTLFSSLAEDDSSSSEDSANVDNCDGDIDDDEEEDDKVTNNNDKFKFRPPSMLKRCKSMSSSDSEYERQSPSKVSKVAEYNLHSPDLDASSLSENNDEDWSKYIKSKEEVEEIVEFNRFLKESGHCPDA